MQINITKDHIERGEICRSAHCPIALAVRDIFPDAGVFVGITDVSINQVKYNLPPVARSFIFNFDVRKPVEPFSFELPIN